jgi:hypothetical protein
MDDGLLCQFCIYLEMKYNFKYIEGGAKQGLLLRQFDTFCSTRC